MRILSIYPQCASFNLLRKGEAMKLEGRDGLEKCTFRSYRLYIRYDYISRTLQKYGYSKTAVGTVEVRRRDAQMV